MTQNELNLYIKHYIEKDYTGSAIMLTGPWGVGKSYYVNNSLIPFLSKEENGGHECIVVSLYGITSYSEISKTIYLEARMKKRIRSEGMVATKVIGKTVLKGITSFFGIDLGTDEKGLQELYQSIDLSGKLIIFEDVERAQINILEFLGYINNLVEQDGVKVLIIANEKRFIKYKPLQRKDNQTAEEFELIKAIDNEKDKEFDDETIAYLSAKEKTISDTIIYDGDMNTAVKQIIERFHNKTLCTFDCEESIDTIVSIMNTLNNYNLRSFIFACQKTVDIYEKIDNIEDFEFAKCIFFSIVAFSLRIKNGERLYWIDRDCSFPLGFEKYPLFKFCYDYIMYQSFSAEKIKPSLELYKDLIKYDENKSISDQDLNTVYMYHIQTEASLHSAINNLRHKLENENNIAFAEYGKLAFYLIRIAHVIKTDINPLKELLINNLENKGNKLRPEIVFRVIAEDRNEKVIKEFNDLKEKMLKALLSNEELPYHFDYTTESIESFKEYVFSNISDIINREAFACNLDIEKLLNLLAYCSAKQIDTLRSIFITVYRNYVIDKDIDSLCKFSTGLLSLQSNDKFDQIQKYQIELFSYNVNNVIERYKQFHPSK